MKNYTHYVQHVVYIYNIRELRKALNAKWESEAISNPDSANPRNYIVAIFNPVYFFFILFSVYCIYIVYICTLGSSRIHFLRDTLSSLKYLFDLRSRKRGGSAHARLRYIYIYNCKSTLVRHTVQFFQLVTFCFQASTRARLRENNMHAILL